MKASRWVWLTLFLLPLILVGCKGNATDQSKGSTQKEYDVKGKVVAIDSNKPAVTLDHEDIPGLMKAMQMEFRVHDAKLLEGIQPGDYVRGKLKKEESGVVITQLGK